MIHNLLYILTVVIISSPVFLFLLYVSIKLGTFAYYQGKKKFQEKEDLNDHRT